MKNKIISKIQAILGFGSFLYLIGLAGSVSINRLSIAEFFGKAWYLIFVPVVMYVIQTLKDEKVKYMK